MGMTTKFLKHQYQMWGKTYENEFDFSDINDICNILKSLKSATSISLNAADEITALETLNKYLLTIPFDNRKRDLKIIKNMCEDIPGVYNLIDKTYLRS